MSPPFDGWGRHHEDPGVATKKAAAPGSKSPTQREDGALDREGVPAEQRPPLAKENWDAALALMKLGQELEGKWPQLRKNLHQSIETPFADHNLPSERDGFGVSDLLHEIGWALNGLHPWAGVRAAYMALRDSERGIQERQAVALARCAWALHAWKKMHRKRLPREVQADYENRVAALRPTEERIAEILCSCLQEQDRGFIKLRKGNVRKRIQALLDERDNVSPSHLLIDLGTLAGVWPGMSDSSLKKSKKRQLGT